MSKIPHFKMFINGEWVNSASNKNIETLNPENNEVWATVPKLMKKMLITQLNLLKKHLIILEHFAPKRKS